METLKDRGLAKATFAKSIGIDDAQFRRLLNGVARWNTWHLDKVAEKLEVSVVDLIKGEPESESEEESRRFVRKFFFTLNETGIRIKESQDITLAKAYQLCRDAGQDIESVCFKARRHLVTESEGRESKNPESDCG